MSKRVKKSMELKCKPAPFRLRIPNQTILDPFEMVENAPIRVGGVIFEATFLLLEIGDAYDMHLGRPSLRVVGVMHDWDTHTN